MGVLIFLEYLAQSLWLTSIVFILTLIWSDWESWAFSSHFSSLWSLECS